jgi:hypothetical protein
MVSIVELIPASAFGTMSYFRVVSLYTDQIKPQPAVKSVEVALRVMVFIALNSGRLKTKTESVPGLELYAALKAETLSGEESCALTTEKAVKKIRNRTVFMIPVADVFLDLFRAIKSSDIMMQ